MVRGRGDGVMKQKVLDAILAILADKRADGEVLPFATSSEVALLLNISVSEVERMTKDVDITKGRTEEYEYYYE